MIKSSIKTIWKLVKQEKKIVAIPISLFITVAILIVFNLEPHQNVLVSNMIFKNILVGVFLFIFSYSILVIEEVIDNYKAVIKDQNRTIEELERLLLKKGNN